MTKGKRFHGRKAGKPDGDAKNQRSGRIEVILEHEYEIPHCAHGPCLLFERYKAKHEDPEQFFACAVCRDRKLCDFYQKVTDEHPTPKKSRQPKQQRDGPKLTHKQLFKRRQEMKLVPTEQRQMCLTCALLLPPPTEDGQPDEARQHKKHELQVGLTNQQLKQPSALLPAATNQNKEAYWFNADTLEFLVDVIQKQTFDAVLCVGCPRLFESLQSRKKTINSMLLDVDARYKQFWSPRQFAEYSMFTHHFYFPLGQKSCEKFLTEAKRLLIFVDPPFGALLAPLAKTMQALKDTRKGLETDVIWVLPYFMEKRIVEVQPDMNMLDYKVDYVNHPVYRKHDSPIRLFTTIPLSKIELPASKGYKFCADCQRYVTEESKHCQLCKTCTSKNGKAYTHCEWCKRCVKPNFVHCFTCSKCHLANVPCPDTRAGVGCCHLCGSPDHKRMDCPNRKRPVATTALENKNKKKQKRN